MRHLPVNKDKVYFRWDTSKGRKIQILGAMVPVGMPQKVKGPGVEPLGEDQSPVYEMSRWDFERGFYPPPKKRSTKGSSSRVRGKENISHG